MTRDGRGERRVQNPTDLLINGLFDAVEPYAEIVADYAGWARYVNWGDRLEATDVITTPGIIRAFKTTPRYDFMPDNVKVLNLRTGGVPIGYEQYISQSDVVGRMVEWLKPRPGHRILDMGSGSGWTTAILGKIVGKSGYVIGTEIVPELAQFGRDNLARYNLANVEIRQTAELGLPSEEPFNRILVSAHLPKSWLDELSQQLSPRSGRMIAPRIPDKYYGDKEADRCDIVSVDRHGREFTTTLLDIKHAFVPAINEADDRFSLD